MAKIIGWPPARGVGAPVWEILDPPLNKLLDAIVDIGIST